MLLTTKANVLTLSSTSNPADAREVIVHVRNVELLLASGTKLYTFLRRLKV